jgi:hypothetical protein
MVEPPTTVIFFWFVSFVLQRSSNTHRHGEIYAKQLAAEGRATGSGWIQSCDWHGHAVEFYSSKDPWERKMECGMKEQKTCCRLELN